MPSHIEKTKSTACVVMLGASNLSRSFPTAVSTLRNTLEAPLSFCVAKGHGRSYGRESSCFGKKISGIFSCGVWDEIAQKKTMPIYAFMTDIGNDLAYEQPVERIIDWVKECLDRLEKQSARIVMTDLPIEVLRTVSATRYRLFRSLLFPGCALTWSEMLARAEQLSQQLRNLGEIRKVPVFVVPREWYGLDPIHLRRGYLPEYWHRLTCQVAQFEPSEKPIRSSWLKRWYLRRLQPEYYSWFSKEFGVKQPSGRLSDGTTLSLY